MINVNLYFYCKDILLLLHIFVGEICIITIFKKCIKKKKSPTKLNILQKNVQKEYKFFKNI